MMDNDDLAQLPIDKFLSTNGLICVWCTNSQSHIDSLKNKMFSAWKIKYVACWYWIKVLVFIGLFLFLNSGVFKIT